MMIFASIINASGLIRYCTRFTEDVFNALLAFNFLSEAFRSLSAEFKGAATAADGLLAVNTGLLTSYLLQRVAAFRTTRYLSPQLRETISDFGPPAVILGVTALSLLPQVNLLGTFSRLSMPGGFQLAGGRALLIPMLDLPLRFRFLALLPAFFLACLFFLDQNITVRTVNSPNHMLKKGAAYHLDLACLGLLTGLASLCGLPWMCSATVQSLNHVRAMSIYKKSKTKDGRETESPESVIETRLTGFGVHAAILASALVVPQLSLVPLPVVAGVFLYLGRKVMTGNQFLLRCRQLFVRGLLPTPARHKPHASHKPRTPTPLCPPLTARRPPLTRSCTRLCVPPPSQLDSRELSVTTVGEKEQVILGKWEIAKFTALQLFCLSALWALKLSPATALIFPSVIGVLMLVRVKIVPKIFKPDTLMLLDTAIGQTSA